MEKLYNTLVRIGGHCRFDHPESYLEKNGSVWIFCSNYGLKPIVNMEHSKYPIYSKEVCTYYVNLIHVSDIAKANFLLIEAVKKNPDWENKFKMGIPIISYNCKHGGYHA